MAVVLAVGVLAVTAAAAVDSQEFGFDPQHGFQVDPRGFGFIIRIGFDSNEAGTVTVTGTGIRVFAPFCCCQSRSNLVVT